MTNGPDARRDDSREDRPPEDRTVAWQQGDRAAHTPGNAGLPVIPGITLQGEIARGGMGVVYRGRQDFLDRQVAVKFLAMELRSDQFAARFRREAKILAGIKHANIVACHSAGTTESGQSYLVMEFVDGPNLKSWIAANGPLAARAALGMTRALAAALGHAHEMEVIHRDIKPENILLESTSSTEIDVVFPFTPKLVDLGLARMTTESVDQGLTSPGSVMGTPATMSPEQFDDPDSVDFRADIYGLGCVLYEMLSGQPAYRSSRLSDLVVMKREPRGPNPCASMASLTASIGDLVSRMLAANRDDRPCSYSQLIELLDELLVQCPAEPRSPAPAPRSSPSPTRPSRTQTTPEVPTQPSGTKTGPGLLKTAEFDFLAAGSGQPAASTPAAFRHADNAVSAQQSSAAIAGHTGTGSVTVPGSRVLRRSILAVAVLAGVGLGVWLVMKSGMAPGAGQQDAASPPASTKDAGASAKPNQAPVAPMLGGPEKISLNKPATFVATASDADGDQLTYRWSSPQARFMTFSPADAASTDVRVLDGLPGEAFTILCAVGDGVNPTVTTSKVVTVDNYPPRSLLAGFEQDDSAWVLDERQAWVQDRENGAVSCRAEAMLRSCSCPLGDEAFWQVVGQLEAARFNAPTFAETGVRFEQGDSGHALICNRSETGGVNWSIELMRAARKDGVWHHTPNDPPIRVEWRDEQDEGHLAYFSIKHSPTEITFQIGCVEQKLLKSQVIRLPAARPPTPPEPRIALFASGGRGVFRKLLVF